MAVTFATTVIHRTVFGNKRIVTADVVATGTATPAGDAYLPAALGLKGIDILLVSSPQTLSTTTGAEATTAEDVGYHVSYDHTNEKFVYTHASGNAGVHIALAGGSVQVTNTTIRVMAVGY